MSLERNLPFGINKVHLVLDSETVVAGCLLFSLTHAHTRTRTQSHARAHTRRAHAYAHTPAHTYKNVHTSTPTDIHTHTHTSTHTPPIDRWIGYFYLYSRIHTPSNPTMHHSRPPRPTSSLTLMRPAAVTGTSVPSGCKSCHVCVWGNVISAALCLGDEGPGKRL